MRLDRQTEQRFKQVTNPDPFYEDQPLNEIDNDVLMALEKGTKPEKRAPAFDRYDAGLKNRDIKEVLD